MCLYYGKTAAHDAFLASVGIIGYHRGTKSPYFLKQQISHR